MEKSENFKRLSEVFIDSNIVIRVIFLFRIHNPKGELSGDFAPWVTVSLSTVEGE